MVTGYEPVPAFLPISQPKLLLKAIYKPLTIILADGQQDVTLVQVRQLRDNFIQMALVDLAVVMWGQVFCCRVFENAG